MRVVRPLMLAMTVIGVLAPGADAQVVRENVPGIRNFAKVESTVACAGAITADAIPAIKKMGYNAIVNLRLASEEGANVPEHTAAALAAGIAYHHIPFSGANPDPAAVDQFLKVMTTPGVAPAFVH
ncbi:MAG: sulfur transferase domain-containing protein [Vicinamibacterales bacterium]